MFGYLIGFDEEWGYFFLNELQVTRIHGLKVKRDLYFKPGTFEQVLAQFRKELSQRPSPIALQFSIQQPVNRQVVFNWLLLHLDQSGPHPPMS